jgi:hypothetical protein
MTDSTEPTGTRGQRRRWWLRFLLIDLIVVAAVGGVYWVVDRLTRQWPNYAQIEEGLYLGGFVREPPPGTRATLNLCENDDPYRVEVHEWRPIPDTAPAPSLDWLRQQVRFVAEQRQAGRQTYVHCRAGVSRGGLVIVAYLMAEHNWSRDEALAFARGKRASVRPNPAFMQLLLDWEKSLRK